MLPSGQFAKSHSKFFFLFLLNLMANLAFPVHLSYPMYMRPSVGKRPLLDALMLHIPQPLFAITPVSSALILL